VLLLLISVVLSILGVLLLWLILPAFVFPPIAFILAVVGYIQIARTPGTWLRKSLYLLAMLLAVAAGILAMRIIGTGYRV
jgi:hypothetical protein